MNNTKLYISNLFISPRKSVKKHKARLISILMFAILLLGNPALAVDNATLEQQKQEAQRKLEETTSQKQTLAAQVSAFDDQVASLQAQINSTQSELNSLNQKIIDTSAQIAKIEADMAEQKKLLGEYIRTMYISGQTSQLELILTSENFSDFVDQDEYIRTVQTAIDNALDEIEAAKKLLESEKNALKDAEAKNLQLKQEQVEKQAIVQTQLVAKQALLETTKGEESGYRLLVDNIQGQIDANNASVWGGSMVSQGHVNKGDVIGYIGNSGYSTGPHLHFEIRDGNKNNQDPANHINNGYFGDPTPGVPTNVPYGYSAAYFAGVFHTGIDRADGGRGTAVRAVADGEIVLRVTGRPNTYPWNLEYGNHVMIRHTNGMYSLYGHLR